DGVCALLLQSDHRAKIYHWREDSGFTLRGVVAREMLHLCAAYARRNLARETVSLSEKQLVAPGTSALAFLFGVFRDSDYGRSGHSSQTGRLSQDHAYVSVTMVFLAMLGFHQNMFTYWIICGIR
ncbi:MAG: hypothetical protein ACXVJU_15660, partial [Candidatus Angelobacter sp.]